jgi:chromosome segregation ATPase
VLSVLLSLFLSVILPPVTRAEEPETNLPPSYQILEPNLMRLIAISNQLNLLNQKLSTELTNSRESSAKLLTESIDYKAAIESYKEKSQDYENKLASYKGELTALSELLRESQSESIALREYQEQCNNLLTKTQQSLKELQEKTEIRVRELYKEINKLTLQRNIAVIAAVAAGIIAALK